MLRESTARTLARHCDFESRQALIARGEPFSREAWARFAELGLLALPFSEEAGGLGGAIADCAAFATSFGEHLVIEPYVAAIMLAGRALAAGDDGAGREWLARVMAGEAIAAFAYEEGSGTACPDQVRTIAEKGVRGTVLTGEKRMVIAGAEADILVVVARAQETGRLGFYLVDPAARGLAIAPLRTIDGRSAATLSFERVVAAAVLAADATQALEAILADAIIVAAAEAVGAMGALVRLTRDHATTRKQFGQPIAGFQAVAHRLADMQIAYTRALATLTYTTALAQSGRAGARDIAILKGQLGKLGRAIGEAAIQTHGGLGLTDELAVGHYHKRLIAFDTALGDHHYHLRRLGAEGHEGGAHG